MKNLLLAPTLLILISGGVLAEKKPSHSDTAPTPSADAARNTSLLKVNVTMQPWNQRIPWQKISPSSRRGLGVLLEGNHILVTAQMVADATYIELEKADSGHRLPAKVKAVDYDANLALLEPAQAVDGFFSGLKPMAVETNAHIGDSLQAWQLDRAGEL
ncbi:MAG: hypothetical protein WCJ41_22210, partial [Aestuariivirga sp.]|uniref:hypothetical protein n=1 Tax=Aestuariivirga sp. TaxID=2650926 RepID=UPI003019D1EC